MKRIYSIVVIIILLIFDSGCMSVKSYQKMYVNDSEMKLAPKKVGMFEVNFQTYREGAAGANGGKVGGGCGCN